MVTRRLGIGVYTFYVDARLANGMGLTGGRIEALLKHYGVRIYNRDVLNGTITFAVVPAQERWARYLLVRAGVPLLHEVSVGSPPASA